jgi:hypothetical protein
MASALLYGHNYNKKYEMRQNEIREEYQSAKIIFTRKASAE